MAWYEVKYRDKEYIQNFRGGISWKTSTCKTERWDYNIRENMRLEVSMAVKIQVEVFWVVTPCGVAVAYQRFAASIFMLKVNENLSLCSF
jgi:hypothetical protein